MFSPLLEHRSGAFALENRPGAFALENRSGAFALEHRPGAFALGHRPGAFSLYYRPGAYSMEPIRQEMTPFSQSEGGERKRGKTPEGGNRGPIGMTMAEESLSSQAAPG